MEKRRRKVRGWGFISPVVPAVSHTLVFLCHQLLFPFENGMEEAAKLILQLSPLGSHILCRLWFRLLIWSSGSQGSYSSDCGLCSDSLSASTVDSTTFPWDGATGWGSLLCHPAVSTRAGERYCNVRSNS